MTPENLLSEWARLFMVSLADGGVSELVVSPGSRSTPFVAAALGSKRFRMWSVVDERSAAFFALGRAKVTGVPAAVLCTSGSAAANYFPAIVEAARARVPMLVLTADRPFELHDCGANQTLDQTKLFGGYVRSFIELGMPEAEPTALDAVRRRASQCFVQTLWPEPGPVHVNLRARKPLEPVAGTSDAALELTRRVTALLGQSRVVEMRPRARVETVSSPMFDALGRATRGVIVCGPGEATNDAVGAAVSRVARALGFPVYAESTSQLRFSSMDRLPENLLLDGLDVLLRARSFRDAFTPEVVLQVGEAPTSGAVERWLAEQPGIGRYVIGSGGWPDPTNTAREVVVGDIHATLSDLALTVRGAAPSTAWSDGLARANAAAWAAVDAVLSEAETLTEGAVLRAAVDALPGRGVLALGNSLPVRHADAFCPARASNLVVWSQRGLSGIDGVVSGAAGAADAAGRPAVLVVGDVSAIHDVGGFAVAKEVRAPFVIVVLNNGGGRIFEQLPLAGVGLGEASERYWTTPHSADFAALTALFGVAHVRVDSVRALQAALAAGLSRDGCTVVEAVVPPHGAREQNQRLVAAVEASLARLEAGP